MLNQELRTVTMTRSDMLRVRQALTSLVVDYQREAKDPKTTEDRRNVCNSSLNMWERIRDDFIQQIADQDLVYIQKNQETFDEQYISDVMGTAFNDESKNDRMALLLDELFRIRNNVKRDRYFELIEKIVSYK